MTGSGLHGKMAKESNSATPERRAAAPPGFVPSCLFCKHHVWPRESISYLRPPPHTHTQALLQNGWHKGTSQMGSSDRAPRCPRVTAAVCEPLRCRGPGRDVGCFTGCPAPLDAFRDVSLLLVMASAVRKLCGQGSYNWECIYGRPYSCLGKY